MDISGLYSVALQWIGDRTGATDSMLHIHAGMTIFLIASFITRRPLSSPIPICAVATAEAVNELLDIARFGRIIPDTIPDIINTMFWPLMLFIRMRLARPRDASTTVVVEKTDCQVDHP